MATSERVLRTRRSAEGKGRLTASPTRTSAGASNVVSKEELERSEQRKLKRAIGVGVYEELLSLANTLRGERAPSLGDLNTLARTILRWESEPLEVENVRHYDSEMSAAGHRRWQTFVRTYWRALSDEQVVDVALAAPGDIAHHVIQAETGKGDRLPLELPGTARAMFIEAGERWRPLRMWLYAQTRTPPPLARFSTLGAERRRRRLAPFAMLEDYKLSAPALEALAEADIWSASQLVSTNLRFASHNGEVRELQDRLRFAFGVSRSLGLREEGVRKYEATEREEARVEFERQAWRDALTPKSRVTMLFNLNEYRLNPEGGGPLLQVSASVVRFVAPNDGADDATVDDRKRAQTAGAVEVEFDEDELPLVVTNPRNSRVIFRMSPGAPVIWSARFTVRSKPAVVYIVPPQRMISDLVRALSTRGDCLEVSRAALGRSGNGWGSHAVIEGRVLDSINNVRSAAVSDLLFRPILRLWADGHVLSFAPPKDSEDAAGGNQLPRFVAARDENFGTPYKFSINYSLQLTPTTQLQMTHVR
jgi:hypothetical protein